VYLLIVVVCLLCANKLLAQRYPFFNLNVENGLIQSQATSLVQDKYGNLWIGTFGGLSRYDGEKFTNYSVHNGMLSNIVSTLAIDNKGDLWIGGQRGISRFNGKNFKQYVFQDEKDNAANMISVMDIRFGNNDTVWCRASGKLYSIANENISQFELPQPGVFVSAILTEGNNLWIAKAGGAIYKYHNGKIDSLVIPVPPAMDRKPFVYKMYKDRKGQIWLAANVGLYKIVQNSIAVALLNKQPLYSLPQIYSIAEDDNGALWMGTSNGAIRLTDNTIQYYNKHNGLTDNTIYNVLTDAEGNVWFATDGQGIFRFSGTQFTVLDESMGLPSAQVQGIASDRNGGLFIGTYDAGLYTFEDGKVNPIAFPSNPVPTITSMLMYEGKLWVGTRNGGLWSYDQIFKSYMYPEHHFPSDAISCLHVDTPRHLWIGFLNGAVLYDHDTFKSIPLNDEVMGFIQIGNDSELIAVTRGVKLYTGGNIVPIKLGNAADSSMALCFTLRGDELWIGTSDNGVVCYNLKTKKSFTLNKENGLQSDFIYNIVTDNDGNIWLGTGYGIHRISVGNNGERVITFYGKQQGITGMESNHNAVYKMQDGSIWFGTTNGAVHYIPHTTVAGQQPVSIVLESVKLFGENINDTSYYDSMDRWYNIPYDLHLPYKKNNITFTFRAITLSGDQQLVYRYHIDGLDAPWSNWSPVNSVTYSALPPGKYVFRVQSNTAPHGKNIKEFTYPFEIITPFEKTGWFRLIILGACILLGIFFQYVVNSRKQRRLRLLAKLRSEEQTKIRLRTAEDFHDEVGNKLTRINVLTNVLKTKIPHLTPDVNRILDQIQDNTGQLYSGTRDILWSLKPANDNLYEILHRIRDFGGELFQDTEIDFMFMGSDERWRQYRLPLDVSRNLIMIFKEALNNILKYACAKNVRLEVILRRKDILQLILTDDGQGFDIHNVKKGHGIDNMNVRANRIHGKLYIDSRQKKGTIINLTFRLPSPAKQNRH